ncbi:MAG: hypothetical protein U1F46_08420 [Marinagarivorans sp.]
MLKIVKNSSRVGSLMLLWLLASLGTVAFGMTPSTPTTTYQHPTAAELVAQPGFDFLSAMGPVTPLTSATQPEFGSVGYSGTYYGQVDPNGLRTTLAAWRSTNGFNAAIFQLAPTLLRAYSAEYINASDLGFGRKMFCLPPTNTARTACYVQNYLDPNNASTFAATVAMERMSNANGSFIAYFVYDAQGKRINQIALDNEGAKSVPESCWACHGGGKTTGAYFGGNFLPFDLDNLSDWPGHATRAQQEARFANLNQLVWNDTTKVTKNAAMQSLIENWYGGQPTSASVYKTAEPPLSWLTYPTWVDQTTVEYRNRMKLERSLYQDVYARNCRMCHVAQELDWQLGKGLDFAFAAQTHICKTGRKPTMPHSELTYSLLFNDKKYQLPAFEASSTYVAPSTNPTGPFSAFELLCSQLPINYAGGASFIGKTLFGSKNCSGCHTLNQTGTSSLGGDLACKGSYLRQNMGAVNAVMSSIQLSLSDMANIAAYINTGCP